MQDACALTFSGGTLLLKGVARHELPLLSGATPWVWDPRVPAWRCDALEYASVVQRLRQVAGRFDDEVPSWRPIRWPKVQIHPLRPRRATRRQPPRLYSPDEGVPMHRFHSWARLCDAR